MNSATSGSPVAAASRWSVSPIGFGRAIWRRLGKDGTEYVLALIPLGGYVKMLDGRVDDLKPGEEQYANQKASGHGWP